MYRNGRVIAAAVLAATLLLAGCGGSSTSTASTSSAARPNPNAPEVVAPGDIPDNQAFVAYRAAGGFSVKVPEGWARTDLAVDHVTFTDKYNAIDLTWLAQPAPPTEGSAAADLDAKRYPDYQLQGGSTVTRPAGGAVLVAYHRTSEPNSVTGKRVTLDVERYSFWKNGTTAVLTLSGATGSDNVDPWKTVTNGFTWTP